ncbi:hypothetical protein AVEN_166083-1, partial [Araneus ventricosus]
MDDYSATKENVME